MPKFGNASKQRLATCHTDLQAVCNELIKYMDFSILCGHRGQTEQNTAFREGTSNLSFPKSAHNSFPSHAVDLVPYPVDWSNLARFHQLHGAFVVVAAQLKERGQIKSEFNWGGEWKNFPDYPHYEIKEK